MFRGIMLVKPVIKYGNEIRTWGDITKIIIETAQNENLRHMA
jgi:hypothetical protein